jgi:drug/metabolite transporter (DMT)-like permease
MPPIDQGATVRLTTPFFNIYGLITLVGGALYSAFLFLRKRVLPNRVLGNVLIAAGALSIGFASTLTRLGYGSLLYLGELVAAVLMYVGFRVAGAPAPQEEREAVREGQPASA